MRIQGQFLFSKIQNAEVKIFLIIFLKQKLEMTDFPNEILAFSLHFIHIANHYSIVNLC